MKSEIFDIDTILYSPINIETKFKKPDHLGLWKNPLAIPCLASKWFLFSLPGAEIEKGKDDLDVNIRALC